MKENKASIKDVICVFLYILTLFLKTNKTIHYYSFQKNISLLIQKRKEEENKIDNSFLWLKKF